MKVFISWSGHISLQVALILREWLPSVLDYIKPFVSSEDIYKGERWGIEIPKKLQETSYGIICLVEGNIDSAWLNFEAGAISKFIDKSKVMPFLLNLEISDLVGHPLSQFQCTAYNKADVYKMINSLNLADESTKINEDSLRELFEKKWLFLQEKLDTLAKKREPEGFIEIFGKDIFIQKAFHLVYAEFALAPIEIEGQVIAPPRFPYCKPHEETTPVRFSIDRPISSCEIRATKYLSESLGKEAKTVFSISSDIELRPLLNISFIAFGGLLSNNKSKDVINNDSNNLVIFDNKKFISASTKEDLIIFERGFDYGLILKLHPRQFPDRVWFTCAGLGEWGTSGAAWFLANKWRDIYSYAGSSPFAFIVKVKKDQDESADVIYKAKS